MAPGPDIEDAGWCTSPVGRLAFYHLRQDLIYLPAAINMPQQRWISDKEVRSIFVKLLDSMSAPAIKGLRTCFTEASELIGRPFERLLLPGP